MPQKLEELLSDIFPAISDRDADRLKKLFRNYRKNEKTIIASTCKKSPSQGDILTNIPFCRFMAGDEIEEYRTYGMILSHSCDYDQRENILIAPAFEIDYFEEAFVGDQRKLDDVRSNAIFNLFYVTSHIKNPQLAIDLSKTNSFQVEFLKENLGRKKVEKVASLSQMGYYFLLMKLTLYLLRPEEDEEGRAVPAYI